MSALIESRQSLQDLIDLLGILGIETASTYDEDLCRRSIKYIPYDKATMYCRLYSKSVASVAKKSQERDGNYFESF